MQINLKKPSIDNTIFGLLLIMPLCAIAGNLLINLNLLLTSILGILLIFKNKNFSFFEKNIELIYLFLFFIISFFISIYFQSSILKFFLTLKFLFFTITIVKFLNRNEHALKKIFIFYSIICLILVIDVIFQSYFEKNILGYTNKYDYSSSFYGEEKLAGFHIQYFSFFAIIFLSNIFKKNIFNDLFLILMLVAIPLSIYVSLNRISILAYFLGVLIYFLLIDKRKKILTLISIPLFIFFAQSHPNEDIKVKYQSFFSHSSKIYTKFKENYNYLENIQKSEIDTNAKIKADERYTGSGHANLFSVAIHLWKENKLLGLGYKNFFKKCRSLENLICSSHPHNIYLDILLTSGILSLVIFLMIIFLLLFKSIKIIFSRYQNSEVTNCLFISCFTFFFPLKSTGSLYASYYGTFSFLLLAFAIFHFNNCIQKNKVSDVQVT